MPDGEIVDRRAELLAELSRSRSQLASSIAGLRVDMDVPAHFKTAVGRNKSIWLGGAALLGWLISRLPARKKTVKVLVDKGNRTEIKKVEKAGLLLGLLKLIFSLLRPIIMGFATKKIAGMTQSKENVERPRRTA
jgi:hypothetical protein